MERKPKNGAYIQNATCGWSGIMMRILIVKSISHDKEQEDDKDNIPHGTQLMKELMLSWANMYKIVCTDSYFELVPAAEELWKHGICFVGVIKTATWQFPMAYISNIHLYNQVDMSGLLDRQIERTKEVLGKFILIYRDKRYFIFTEVSIEKGWL